MQKRIITVSWFGLLALLGQTVTVQAEPCKKPRVSVEIIEIYDHVLKYMETHIEPGFEYFESKEDTISRIHDIVTEILRTFNPGTTFVQDCDDCDYKFRYILSLLWNDEEYRDDGSSIPGYTAYWFMGQLLEENACGFWDRYLKIKDWHKLEGLRPTIRTAIGQMGDIGKLIERHERRYRVPPRGPRMTVALSKDHVSASDNDRKIEIKIDIIDCKGRVTFDKYHGQVVILPRRTKRGELRPTPSFPQECFTTENLITLTIVRPVGASATYTLKKGLAAGVEGVKITSCGRDKQMIEQAKIKIWGLEIKVVPRKKQVCPQEKTKVDIKLVKTGPDGSKKPLSGTKIKLVPTGLVDGNVTPLNNIVTDKEGQATVTYHAGVLDKRVTFKAKYQPQGSKESVQDKATIDVSCTLTRTAMVTRKYRKSTDYTKSGRNTEEKHSWKEDSEITVTMKLSKNPRVDVAFDPVTRQTKPRRYVYELEGYWISSSSHSGSGSSEETVGSGQHLQRSVSRSSSQNGTFQDLRPNSKGSRLTVTVDPSTGRATKVSLPSFTATISIMSIIDCKGQKKVKFKLEPFDCSSTRNFTQDFGITPWEGCLKIKGGDGLKVINGGCNELKTTSQGSTEEIYEWVIYMAD